MGHELIATWPGGQAMAAYLRLGPVDGSPGYRRLG